MFTDLSVIFGFHIEFRNENENDEENEQKNDSKLESLLKCLKYSIEKEPKNKRYIEIFHNIADMQLKNHRLDLNSFRVEDKDSVIKEITRDMERLENVDDDDIKKLIQDLKELLVDIENNNLEKYKIKKKEKKEKKENDENTIPFDIDYEADELFEEYFCELFKTKKIRGLYERNDFVMDYTGCCQIEMGHFYNIGIYYRNFNIDDNGEKSDFHEGRRGLGKQLIDLPTMISLDKLFKEKMEPFMDHPLFKDQTPGLLTCANDCIACT